jgi:choline dehydrogenase-like flavoprotein
MKPETPRTGGGRAPDVFARGGWVPMREYAEAEPVDFAIVGAGAGGATLACKLAEAGFSVVVLEAGPFWRPLDDFASDEQAQQALYWTDDRLTRAPTRSPSAATTPGAGWAARRSTSA